MGPDLTGVLTGRGDQDARRHQGCSSAALGGRGKKGASASQEETTALTRRPWTAAPGAVGTRAPSEPPGCGVRLLRPGHQHAFCARPAALASSDRSLSPPPRAHVCHDPLLTPRSTFSPALRPRAPTGRVYADPAWGGEDGPRRRALTDGPAPRAPLPRARKTARCHGGRPRHRRQPEARPRLACSGGGRAPRRQARRAPRGRRGRAPGRGPVSRGRAAQTPPLSADPQTPTGRPGGRLTLGGRAAPRSRLFPATAPALSAGLRRPRNLHDHGTCPTTPPRQARPAPRLPVASLPPGVKLCDRRAQAQGGCNPISAPGSAGGRRRLRWAGGGGSTCSSGRLKPLAGGG